MSPPTREELLESVTRQALEAAQNGRWDEVTRCVERRGELLPGSEPSPAMVARLVGLDQRIGEKVRLVRGAVGQVLSEVAATRALMKRFSQRRDGRDVGDRVDQQV
ncbi:MAG: hypothetical protein ACREJU_18155 [Nitrospiraceae bacterium]